MAEMYYGPLGTSESLYGEALLQHDTPASWSDWNSTSGGQGYWLIGASVILIVTGSIMVASKAH
jgi:hypothetical protein